jgi:ATP adenylyltransferase/5',5'''-P-1,P-4-tetraphosphate phosphorylase II
MGKFVLQAQWNPKRIISTAAKIDAGSIQKRPCILCSQNRPLEQEGILYRDQYQILVNPYPVFDRHLTIVSLSHTPQRIEGNFGKMLQLARDLKGYSVIYNGPACGASAPDHFHFQAVPAHFLPVNEDFKHGNQVAEVAESKGLKIFIRNNAPAKAITIAGSSLQMLRAAFGRIYDILEQVIPSSEEPMMNMIASFDEQEWMVHIYPRRRHRPHQYFAEGNEKILLSPASIDMGGVLVIPREEDFNRISEKDVEDILNQVCVEQELIRTLIAQIKEEYV